MSFVNVTSPDAGTVCAFRCVTWLATANTHAEATAAIPSPTLLRTFISMLLVREYRLLSPRRHRLLASSPVQLDVARAADVARRLLLEHRMRPARGENARRRPEAQVIHVLRDIEPSV